VTADLEINARSIRARIEAACERAKRAPTSVKLLAVSKTKPSSDVERAYALGLRDFGENYVQELVVKRAALEHLTEARWHLIGHLQSNKVAKAVTVAHVIHTIDSIKRAQEIDRRALAARVTVEGFIEVNVGEEPQKAGAKPSELPDLVAALRDLGNVTLLGLMAIPPERSDAEASRSHFRRLRELASGFELGRLSMGMSHDFEVAIEEGATDVRVGSALFGARI
jgi:PLP dependent protein